MLCLNSPIASGQAPLYPANGKKCKETRSKWSSSFLDDRTCLKNKRHIVLAVTVSIQHQQDLRTAAVPKTLVVTTCCHNLLSQLVVTICCHNLLSQLVVTTCPRSFPEEEVHLPGLLPKGSPAVSQISTFSFLST